ncbi:MAG TPA: hypothetical protein VNV85_02225 [Puia sp.]|jgi:hypothetical protein|nr:hypothetical protein [Puia sp.]
MNGLIDMIVIDFDLRVVARFKKIDARDTEEALLTSVLNVLDG